jgi:hypothetical protein
LPMEPKRDVACQRPAELLRERRRRRLEATGQPYEEPPWHTVPLLPGRRLLVAETLRIGGRLAHERAGGRAGAEIATDICA